MTTQLTLQQSNNNLALPQLIDDVKPSCKGYRVFSGGRWEYYAAECLTEEEVQRFDWLLSEYQRKAA